MNSEHYRFSAASEPRTLLIQRSRFTRLAIVQRPCWLRTACSPSDISDSALQDRINGPIGQSGLPINGRLCIAIHGFLSATTDFGITNSAQPRVDGYPDITDSAHPASALHYRCSVNGHVTLQTQRSRRSSRFRTVVEIL